MRKVIAVRFDGVLGRSASSITPGKVYPLVVPVYENVPYGRAMLNGCEITVTFNRESAHLGGKKWTLIYEDVGTIIISNENTMFLTDLTLGKEYKIEGMDDEIVKIKNDAQTEVHLKINSRVTFYIIINNQVINNKKYEHTRTTTA